MNQDREKTVKISVHKGDIVNSKADAIVVGIGTDLELGPYAAAVNKATSGAIQRLVDCGEIKGKPHRATTILAPAGIAATHLVVTGLGDGRDAQTAFRAASASIRAINKRQRDGVIVALDADFDELCQEAMVAGLAVGAMGQDLYRADKNRHCPDEILVAGVTAEICERGRLLGEGINLTRRLVNLPAQDMYPESFAAEAMSVAETSGIEIEIWDETKLREQKCEALLAVARGSSRGPRLVIMKYSGGPADAPPLALVGKGVTFDSGGLSLKPSDGMKAMKCDMAGAATVLGAMQAIARLKVPANVVGVMGLVENLVGPDSYKLGDVLTARSGKTIEVLNTDAEGRLVLADALSVTVDLGAERIIDLATLTGACVVALGTDVAGVMTNNDPWCQQVQQAAHRCGEFVWQLPMFDFYAKQIQSEVADIKNVGDGRWGGAITAAKLLEEFVDEVPWVHIDIAGPSFADKQKPWMEAGATGVMVRSLVEVARHYES